MKIYIAGPYSKPNPLINVWYAISTANKIRFVDHYKIGKLNYMESDIDWKWFTHKVVELLERVGATYYLKEDLKEYLDES